jgi:hypothetical protein
MPAVERLGPCRDEAVTSRDRPPSRADLGRSRALIMQVKGTAMATGSASGNCSAIPQFRPHMADCAPALTHHRPFRRWIRAGPRRL